MLTQACIDVLWITKPTNGYKGVEKGAGRARWLHATPLLSASGAVGVWMIVLVDDDSERTKTLQGYTGNNTTAPIPNRGGAPPIKSPMAHLSSDDASYFDFEPESRINSDSKPTL